MEQTKKTLLVAWDFSNVADYAMQYAILFAQALGNMKVTLLNIVESEGDVEKVTAQLQVVADDAEVKYGYKPEVLAVKGDIFTTINEVAEKLEVPYVFMGTHGMKGLQKITGSWALKVIEGSSCPFIVVQRPPHGDKNTGIVCPINYRKEDKQKVAWAVYVNKFFKAKFFLYVQKSSNETLRKQIYSNRVHIKSVLDKNGIEYEEVEGIGEGDFADEVIEYANNIEANAILVSTSRTLDFTDYMLFGVGEQKIIANKYGIATITAISKPGKLKGFN